MINVALLGGSGGIGSALLSQLMARDDIATIHSSYHSAQLTELQRRFTCHGEHKLHWSKVDVRSEASISAWMANIDSLHWVINCAGILHSDAFSPEKSIKQFEAVAFEQNLAVNCLSTLLLAKHVEKKLPRTEFGVFASVTAKVGSIADNRLGGWYSYRASKAAANMSLKTLSVEWQRTLPNIRVLALHPGTTDTALSKPFQKSVPAGRLFTTEYTAANLLSQIEQCHKYPSGRFIAFDGEELPW